MNLQQIFEYAIEQEIKAREFYGKSAASTDNATASSLFRSLARMEAGHRRALESELNVLKETGQVREPKESLATPQEEMLASLYRVTKVLKEANVELESKQKTFESELRMAGEIQVNLLPKKVPQLPGLDISVACLMAKHVGGDYYDFMFNPLGHLSLAIGDVSGKGMPAALLMVAIRTLWRSAVRDGNTPERILELLTEDASAEFSQSDQFITMISGSYDPALHIFSFSNAGHWPPLYYSAAEDAFLPFPPGHVPLGLDLESTYKVFEVRLKKGDVVVLFSDGLIEARNKDREEYSEDRLADLIYKNKDVSAEAMRETIMSNIDLFAAGARDDDQTLIILKRV